MEGWLHVSYAHALSTRLVAYRRKRKHLNFCYADEFEIIGPASESDVNWPSIVLFMLTAIHIYIIGNYNPSVRIMF